MCLALKKSKREADKWLEDKPKDLILYKVVIKIGSHGDYYPPFYNLDSLNSIKPPYRAINKIKKKKPRQEIDARTRKDGTRSRKTSYVPHFHFFVNESDAKNWQPRRNTVVIKCHVPKKFVTAIGEQYYNDSHECYYYETVVAREFTTIGEVK